MALRIISVDPQPNILSTLFTLPPDCTCTMWKRFASVNGLVLLHIGSPTWSMRHCMVFLVAASSSCALTGSIDVCADGGGGGGGGYGGGFGNGSSSAWD